MSSGKSRVVIVTGGGSGIGRGIAAAFAEHGDHVIIMGRNEEKLRAAALQLGPNVTWERADVGRSREVVSAVENIAGRFGDIHILVNNAGPTSSPAITTDTSLEEAERTWDEDLASGLKGAFLMSMAVAPHLAKPGGRIINISSIAAFIGGSRPGSLAYAIVKAGILGLTYSLARELSPKGLTVNAIAPGFIANTGLTGGWPEDRVRTVVGQTPVGREGRPEDVAAACVYLASPEASFVTGEVINVNGGWLFGH